MFPTSEKYINMSDKEKIAKTEEFFASLQKKKERIFEEKQELVCKIDQILQSDKTEKYSELFLLLEEDRYYECIAFSYELTSFKRWKQITNMEQEQKLFLSLDRRKSFQEACDIYQKVLFYLHRIEFDLPLDLQLELFSFMEEEKVSPVSVFFIFHTEQIIEKKKVALQLSQLFLMQGNEVWSLFFQKWVEAERKRTITQ